MRSEIQEYIQLDEAQASMFLLNGKGARVEETIEQGGWFRVVCLLSTVAREAEMEDWKGWLLLGSHLDLHWPSKARYFANAQLPYSRWVLRTCFVL